MARQEATKRLIFRHDQPEAKLNTQPIVPTCDNIRTAGQAPCPNVVLWNAIAS